MRGLLKDKLSELYNANKGKSKRQTLITKKIMNLSELQREAIIFNFLNKTRVLFRRKMKSWFLIKRENEEEIKILNSKLTEAIAINMHNPDFAQTKKEFEEKINHLKSEIEMQKPKPQLIPRDKDFIEIIFKAINISIKSKS